MIPFINMKVSQLLAAICVLVCSVIIVKKRLEAVKAPAKTPDSEEKDTQ